MTTPATTPDCVMGPTIQHDLATRDLLPGMHLLDGGYVDAELLVTAQTQHQIDVVGPPFGSYSHQRRAGQGYDLSAFVIDWEAQQARCPQGQTSVKWTPGRDVSGDPVVRIRFDARDLSRLSGPPGVHLGQRCPAPTHRPAASPPRGDPGRAATAGDRRVHSPVCPAGRD